MEKSDPKANPEISVIMGVRNGEKYLAEAVESILSQTFGNFEYIIVNDGSTDNTLTMLQGFAKQDPRIKVIDRQASGLPTSLNIAIDRATAPFIARMDADDMSMPQRFSRQIAFLRQNEDIAVVGSSAIIIDSTGKRQKTKTMPITPQAVREKLPHRNCLVHPATMIRRDVLQNVGGYNVNYVVSQDYDLWLRILTVSDLANLEEPLLKLRTHSDQVTKTKSTKITMNRVAAVSDYFLRKYGISNDVLQRSKYTPEGIAAKILELYDLAPSSEDLPAINASAIRFFRRADLDQNMSAKLNAAIIKTASVRERIKHLLYKTGL
ncbi:MAG: glycosyltransferase family 2 protein [Rhodobacteraceae bacterium]|nr:glycosyltransferase family 2 protein [Paracoccaceae bacterium]